jgi:hypothetical protein
MPLGCMRAITHLSTSTLLQLRVKRSVIIECRKKWSCCNCWIRHYRSKRW